MPVMAPTVEEVGSHLTELMGRYPGHIWAWDELVASARRRFASTSPAIRNRLDVLVDEGQLVGIGVNPGGWVYWGDSHMAAGYFVPEMRYSYSPLVHGPVTWVRPVNRDNLWVGGERMFYTTPAGLEEFRLAFTAKKEARRAADAEDRRESMKDFRAAVRKVAPDGLSLLRMLRDRLPSSTLDVRMSTVNDSYEDKTPHPSVALRIEHEDLEEFLGVLRAGVVLRDFAERNGVSDADDTCDHPNGFGVYGCPCGATRDDDDHDLTRLDEKGENDAEA